MKPNTSPCDAPDPGDAPDPYDAPDPGDAPDLRVVSIHRRFLLAQIIRI